MTFMKKRSTLNNIDKGKKWFLSSHFIFLCIYTENLAPQNQLPPENKEHILNYFILAILSVRDKFEQSLAGAPEFYSQEYLGQRD